MAITDVAKSISISIEVQNGVDKAGDPTYTKKTFANVRTDVDAQSAYDVAEAIKAVLDAGTRDTFLNKTSSLQNA
jgi:hypothetical protein